MLPPEQIVVVVDVIVTVGTTLVAVIAISLLVAVVGVAHGSLLVITTVTLSPLARVVVVKVAAVCPATDAPFTIHWYVGEAPPLTGVAVKVTLPPEHILVEDALIVTDGVTFDVGFAVTELVGGLVHPAMV